MDTNKVDVNAIETKELNCGYDKAALLKEVGIQVTDGEIVVLIGPNGAGKTTLLKTIAGLLPQIGGSVYLQGNELSELSGRERAQILSVMLTEKNKYDYTTCEDVVRVGRFPYTGVMGKMSETDEKTVREVMDQVGITDLADKDFDKISDGQRQRVLLARALVQEPSVMILDEPTSFLDVGYKLEFMSLLKQLSRDKKIGILMSLHELDLAAAVADRIVAIDADNRVDLMGVPGEVLQEAYLRQLFHIKDGSYSLQSGFTLASDGQVEERRIDKANVHISENVPDTIQLKEMQSTKEGKRQGTHYLMIQGTMSNAGKSLVVAGLCRIFKQDGYRVSPFKSQNMALNSFVTEDGLEMGRAQVMQAEAAGVKPDVHMNPILLKPTDDQGSQVIVNGEVRGNMRAREYFQYKKSLVPDIQAALSYLEERNDIIVIEGAGSPAEINLKQNDIVNMGIAKLTHSPVLLVGDIDRGGVFAQLLGTLELLEEDEKELVKGLIVNKFRGDKTILDPGITMLEERGNKPVVGVLPYMDINLEDEDSLTDRFEHKVRGLIDLAVIRLPHISNFTDFDVFEQIPEVSVRYVRNCRELEKADMVILPGSKNTVADMRWLRENGFEAILLKVTGKGIPIFGVCGGYQMLGQSIDDPECVEGGGRIQGLSLLPYSTILQKDKQRKQVEGILPQMGGDLAKMSGCHYYGYEIHMGRTGNFAEDMDKLGDSANDMGRTGALSDVIVEHNNVYGTYVHGIFDHEEVARAVIDSLADKKKITVNTGELLDYSQFKEGEYDRLANTMREYLKMDQIYEMMGL